MNKFRWKETECSCDECVGMCKYRPCWGTPQELKKIIDAGLGHKLMMDWWAGGATNGEDILILCGAIKGYEQKKSPWMPVGECAFLDDSNKCELHKLGLKPLEGRTADCKSKSDIKRHEKVALTWNNKKAQRLAMDWEDSLPSV
jgi:hypothetical protein